jgi:hypothetical protein
MVEEDVAIQLTAQEPLELLQQVVTQEPQLLITLLQDLDQLQGKLYIEELYFLKEQERLQPTVEPEQL